MFQWIWEAFAWLMKPQPSLTIDERVSSVGYTAPMRGKLRAPLAGYLQVFVRAEDGRWYLQEDVELTGRVWRLNCRFGFPDGPTGHEYTVVALMSPTKVIASPLEDLPVTQATLQSNAVTVRRVS